MCVLSFAAFRRKSATGRRRSSLTINPGAAGMGGVDITGVGNGDVNDEIDDEDGECWHELKDEDGSGTVVIRNYQYPSMPSALPKLKLIWWVFFTRTAFVKYSCVVRPPLGLVTVGRVECFWAQKHMHNVRLLFDDLRGSSSLDSRSAALVGLGNSGITDNTAVFLRCGYQLVNTCMCSNPKHV